MITCKQVIEFLDSYVDRELPETEALSFEKHLEVCPSCVAYLDGYRRSIALTRGVRAVDESAVGSMPEDLVRAVLASRPKG